MSEADEDLERRMAERRCIVTGASADTGHLIRFVVGPDETIVPDLAGKLPGRGIWVTAEAEAVEKAAKANLFARAARTRLSVPDGLGSMVEALLVRRAVDSIGLARRAGEIVSGMQRILDKAKKAGSPVALIEARDGSADGRRKLLAGLRQASGAAQRREIPVKMPLFADEMGLAFGATRVIHAALFTGRTETKLLVDLGRLEAYGRSERPRTEGQE